MLECLGGPLDGHIASPSDVRCDGTAVFGLALEPTDFDFGKGRVSAFIAKPPTHKQARHATYAMRAGRLIYVGTAH